MERREFDPMALVGGLFFAAIAVVYMLDAAGTLDARPGLLLALSAIAIGASGLTGALWAARPGRRAPKAPAPYAPLWSEEGNEADPQD